MNKKYFAKYLVVEGEPTKIGDCFEIEKGSVAVITKVSPTQSWHVTAKGLTGFFKNKEGTHNLLGPQKKMKLFLCTKDIQKGDEVRDSDNNACIVESITESGLIRLRVEKKFYTDVIGSCYKAIGKISSEAIWVNPGDKFDKNEVAAMLIDDTEPTSITKDTVPRHVGYVVIKCSQCNKFH